MSLQKTEKDQSKAANARKQHFSEDKQSWVQAASQTQPTWFSREVEFNIGVVECIHRVRNLAYARVTVGMGDEYSIKIPPVTDLHPGDLLQITEAKINGTTRATIYGPHTGPVTKVDQPLCKGLVKWYDHKLDAWTVKVRSSRKHLLYRPNREHVLRDQVIYFIPKFKDGKLEIGEVIDSEGGIPEGTAPTWVVSKPVTDRLLQTSPRLVIVNPTTRAEPEFPQLDLNKAKESLPPDSNLQNQPYLQLEELMLRQLHPTADFKSQEFQRQLADGLEPLLFISDDEPDKIWSLREDIRAIQAAGLQRIIRVLYPAPPMINVASVATTMSTKLVNPKVFPITSIRLFNHPGIVTRKLGDSSKCTPTKVSLNTLPLKMSTHSNRCSLDPTPKPAQRCSSITYWLCLGKMTPVSARSKNNDRPDAG